MEGTHMKQFSITQQDGGFVIAFRYDPTLVAAVKEIPGRRYQAASKSWSLPATAAAARGALVLARDYQADMNDATHAALTDLAGHVDFAPKATAAKKYDPTPEQVAVIEAALTGDDLKCVAYAGAGKTSTLVLVAEALAPRRGVYLAFNRVTADEAHARFPRNVECRTGHSFAYQATNASRFRTKLNARIYPSLIASLLGLPDDGAYGRTQMNLVRAIQATLREFMQSAATEILVDHVPAKHLAAFKPGDDDTEDFRAFRREARNGFVALVVEAAQRLWVLQIDERREDVPMTHDHYLKLWHLSGATLPCEFLLVDEAQDLNPVMLAIIQAQPAQKIWVGDPHQQIYAWRGAVNAMETVAARERHITQSFRWGNEVARVANAILAMKGPLAHPVRGFEKKATVLGSIDPTQPVTIISRGNARLFAAAIESVTAGLKLSVVGSLKGPIDLMESAYALSRGNLHAITDPEIKVYQTWEELKAAAEDDHGLDQVVKQVDRYGDQIPGICDTLRRAGEVAENRADVVLTTAHKAKGREWAQVQLAGDFGSHLAYLRRGEPLRVEELNILYVAATRAIGRIELNAAAEELMDGELVRAALTEGGLLAAEAEAE
jgi:hypothetical protein